MWAKHKQQSGFTIVELLIVIVVIAILAAISIVAYNGIQQRAKNTSIINAVSTTMRLVSAYVADKGQYPLTYNGDVCITATSGCPGISSAPTFDTEMAIIGTPPKSIPNGTPGYGIFMSRHSQATYNGVSAPVRITYFLFGTNQQCGVSGVQTYTWPAYESSTTGYTVGNSNGQTQCWVNIPGPAAS